MPDIFVSTPKAKKTNDQINKGGFEKPKNEKNLSKDIMSEKYESSHLENKVHLFSSLLKNPHHIFFKNQEPEEKVLLFIRKHLITNIKWVALSILLLIAPPFALPLGAALGIPVFFFSFTYLLFFLLLYYLLVATYIYVNFITWYFNISIVTNIRVIDIDFAYLIYKNIAATKLSLVQDVNFDQIGVMPIFFNYGDVFVQTAGENTNFEFLASPQPENVVHIVHNLIGKHGTV